CASPTSSGRWTVARPTMRRSTSSPWAAPSLRPPRSCSPRTAIRTTCACTGLEDNAKVAELLEADRIAVTVGEDTEWQYQPEQTTSAIICHHPKAKYFLAR